MKGEINSMSERFVGFRQNRNQDCNGQAGNIQGNRNRCDGCICDQLRNLPTGTVVAVFLFGSATPIALVFINLDNDNCCAFFTQPGVAGSTVIIDCEKIQAIRITPATV
jgi:hypothetical protein